MPELSTYPPFYSHDAIEEIITDVFMVRGTIQMNALMRISRNMAVVRHDGDLTFKIQRRFSFHSPRSRHLVKLQAANSIRDNPHTCHVACKITRRIIRSVGVEFHSEAPHPQ